MTPTNAGWLNTIYYAAYTIGRLVSVPLSTIVSPAKIIMSSCVACLLATVIMILFGNYNSYALFASTGNQFFLPFYLSNLFIYKNLTHRATWIWCLFPFWIWYFMDYLKYSIKYEKQANVFHFYGCNYSYLCWSYSSQ